MTYEAEERGDIPSVSPLEGIILRGYLENSTFVFMGLAGKRVFLVYTQY
jgi:hypothetical protein